MKKLILLLLICGRLVPAQMGSVTDSARWLEYQRALAPLENVGEKPGNWRRSEYTVSVARLSHRPPGKAVSAYSRGIKFAEAGNWQKGVDEFAKAVEIDPNFADAHGNLGANYVRLGKYEDAEKELRRAIQLDPATGSNHSNLGLLLTFVGRNEEAEYEARAGVDLDPHNFKSQYLLGILLMRNPKSLARAAECLEYAAREFPDAHLVLAKLHRNGGDEAMAAMELQRYKKKRSNEQAELQLFLLLGGLNVTISPPRRLTSEFYDVTLYTGVESLRAETKSVSRILIIEDNPADVFLLRHALDERGDDYVLEVLRDGDEAIRFIQRYRFEANTSDPCVIVLDLHLPKHDGASVLHAIRDKPPLAEVQVVVLTTLANPEDETEIRELGVRLYRTKPTELDGWTTLACQILEICHEGRPAVGSANPA